MKTSNLIMILIVIAAVLLCLIKSAEVTGRRLDRIEVWLGIRERSQP